MVFPSFLFGLELSTWRLASQRDECVKLGIGNSKADSSPCWPLDKEKEKNQSKLLMT